MSGAHHGHELRPTEEEKRLFEELCRERRTTLEALADLNAAARDLCEALKAAYLCPLWRFARRLLRAPREGER